MNRKIANVGHSVGIKYHQRTEDSLKQKMVCLYFEAFLDFYAVFLLVPFRVKINTKIKEYVIVSSKFRKIVVGTMHVIYLVLGIILMLRTLSLLIEKRRDISTAFYTLSHLGTFVAMVIMLKIFNFNQNEILHFMNSCSVQIDSKPATIARIVGFLACFVYQCTSMIQEFMTSQGKAEMAYLYKILNQILTCLVNLMGFNPLNILTYLVPDTVLCCVSKVVVSLYFAILNTYLPLLLIISLTMNTLAREKFIKSVEQSYGNITTVMKQYAKLQQKSEILTTLFGNLILIYYGIIVTFLAQMPQIVLIHNAPDGYVKIFLLVYIFYICMAMYQATNFHAQVNKCCRKFITAYYKRDDWNPECKQRLQLIALTLEMDADPVGISCSFFTITKNFLGSSIGLATTYSLIVFQMWNNESKIFWEA